MDETLLTMRTEADAGVAVLMAWLWGPFLAVMDGVAITFAVAAQCGRGRKRRFAGAANALRRQVRKNDMSFVFAETADGGWSRGGRWKRVRRDAAAAKL